MKRENALIQSIYYKQWLAQPMPATLNLRPLQKKYTIVVVKICFRHILDE